jgi:hypothetical protein
MLRVSDRYELLKLKSWKKNKQKSKEKKLNKKEKKNFKQEEED